MAALAGSLGMHLLPLAFLVGWSSTRIEFARPIPVQLVLEEPPPAPPAPPAPEAKPPPSPRLASDEIGDTAQPPTAPATSPAPTPAPVAPAPRVAELVPPPKPKPSPPAKPAAATAPVHRPEPKPQTQPHAARIPGPDATRDEYLAYLVALTRRHMDMLPLNMIGGRRGETVLAILVLGDGTIARVGIARSSGYPDIDARIEQMVSAVRRFPPLPQWFQGPRIELNLRLRFPEAVLEP